LKKLFVLSVGAIFFIAIYKFIIPMATGGSLPFDLTFLSVSKEEEKVVEIDKVESDRRFIEAAAKGDLEVINFLLVNGADINAVDAKGRTALHFAASSGRVRIVKYLINKGADIKIRDKSGRSAHFYAKKANYTKIADILKGGK